LPDDLQKNLPKFVKIVTFHISSFQSTSTIKETLKRLKDLQEKVGDEFEREKCRTKFFELLQGELSRAFSIQFASSPFDVEFHLEFVGKVCHKMETVCDGDAFNKIGPTCNYETF